jgi:hypothetical protein
LVVAVVESGLAAEEAEGFLEDGAIDMETGRALSCFVGDLEGDYTC